MKWLGKMGKKVLEFHYRLWTVEENLRHPVLVFNICLCKDETNDRTIPLKSFHSWIVQAVLYFHYSHSKFSFPVLFLKANITEFQKANMRKVVLLFLHLHSQAVFLSISWQLPVKVDGPLVWPEHIFVYLAFLLSQFWEFHYSAICLKQLY